MSLPAFLPLPVACSLWSCDTERANHVTWIADNIRKIFKPLHPPDALDILEDYQHLGPVDPTTLPDEGDVEPTEEEKRIQEERKKLPQVDAMLLLDDFEEWAEKVLSGTAWNYYKSAGEYT